MYNPILILIIILSVLIVITVIMQPGKQNSAAGALAGGVDKLSRKQKTRGLGAVMQRSTVVFNVTWMILLFILALLSSK